MKVVGPEEPLRLTTDPAPDGSPAWSPDGRWIAFLRGLPNERAAVMLIPVLGGAERKLAEISINQAYVWTSWSGSRALEWSPDGKSLVVAERPAPGKPEGLFLLSIDTGEQHRLTSPPPAGFGDRSPAFSPDGRWLAFSRAFTFFASDIYVLKLSADLRAQSELDPLTRDGRWNESPVWINNHEILFSSNRDGTQALWRVPASGSQSPKRLRLTGQQDIVLPSYSRQAHRLAYVDEFLNSNIWRTSLSDTSPPPAILISSSRRNSNPDYSPDGRKIAFSSNRSGNMDIFVCDSEGLHTQQLTNFGRGNVGWPRWSPDGKWIALDSTIDGQTEIYMIGAEGGMPKRLTDPPYFNAMPEWSRDGAWIYFTSQRSGGYEIWKMPSRGGQAVRVTKYGGESVGESPDGRTLYYQKQVEQRTVGAVFQLWEMPVAGGAEKQVVDAGLGLGSFFPTEQGIYYLRPESPAGWSIRLFRPARRSETNIVQSTKSPEFRPAVSPDRRWLLYGQIDQSGGDLMLVENFR